MSLVVAVARLRGCAVARLRVRGSRGTRASRELVHLSRTRAILGTISKQTPEFDVPAWRLGAGRLAGRRAGGRLGLAGGRLGRVARGGGPSGPGEERGAWVDGRAGGREGGHRAGLALEGDDRADR